MLWVHKELKKPIKNSTKRYSISILSQKKYYIYSFLIPVLYRSVLEILAGPYPLGFDTNTTYILRLLQLLENKKYLSVLPDAPLYYWILYILSFFLGLLISIKILSIILSGLLGLSIFNFFKEFSNKKMTDLQIFELSMLTFFYFPLLRVTWDLHRNILGMILVFYSITLLNKRPKVSFILAFLAGLAHQLTLPLLGSILFPQIIRKKRRALLLLSFNFVSWFIVIYFDFSRISKKIIITNTTSNALIGIILLEFSLWIMAPLIFFIVLIFFNIGIHNIRRMLSIKKIKNNGLFGCMTLLYFSSFITPVGYRVILLITIPAMFFCYILIISYHKRLLRLFKITIVILALSYTVAPIFDGISIYPVPTERFSQWGPSGMFMGTLPIRDLDAAKTLFIDVKNLINDSTALIITTWVLTPAYLAGINISANYVFIHKHYQDIKEILNIALSNFSIVYFIWYSPNTTFLWSDLINITVEDIYWKLPKGYTILKIYDRMALYIYK